MTDTLQLEDAIEFMTFMTRPDCWSSGPRAGRSSSPRFAPRLAARAPGWPGKHRTGWFRIADMLASLLLEAFLLFVVIVLPKQID